MLDGFLDRNIRPLESVREPRQLREYGKLDRKNKPWQSCWLEVSSEDKTKLLRESGFDGP